MSLLDKVKEFAESEEVQKGILKVKENTEEIINVLIVRKRQQPLFLNQTLIRKRKRV